MNFFSLKQNYHLQAIYIGMVAWMLALIIDSCAELLQRINIIKLRKQPTLNAIQHHM